MREGKIRKMAEVAFEVEEPWKRAGIDVHDDKQQIDILIGYDRGTRFSCPKCGAGNQPVHDSKRRAWEHVRVGDRRCRIEARVPRVNCGECGKVSQAEVPWARSHSRFTRGFEELLANSCEDEELNAVADRFNLPSSRILRVKKHYDALASSKEDPGGERRPKWWRRI